MLGQITLARLRMIGKKSQQTESDVVRESVGHQMRSIAERIKPQAAPPAVK